MKVNGVILTWIIIFRFCPDKKSRNIHHGFYFFRLVRALKALKNFFRKILSYRNENIVLSYFCNSYSWFTCSRADLEVDWTELFIDIQSLNKNPSTSLELWTGWSLISIQFLENSSAASTSRLFIWLSFLWPIELEASCSGGSGILTLIIICSNKINDCNARILPQHF